MSDLLSFDEIRILSHALGYPRNYRNYYSCDPSVSKFQTLQSLAARGYLHEDTTFDQFNRTFTRYSVTAKGKLYLDDLHAALILHPLPQRRVGCPNCICDQCDSDVEFDEAGAPT